MHDLLNGDWPEDDLRPIRKDPKLEAKRWNDRHGVGTPVRYWTSVRSGSGKAGETRSLAQVLGGHTAVVWVTGYSACVALTHVEAVLEES